MALDNGKVIKAYQPGFGAGGGTAEGLIEMINTLNEVFVTNNRPIREAMNKKQHAVSNFDELLKTWDDSVRTIDKINWGLLKVITRTNEWKQKKGKNYATLKDELEKVFGKGSMAAAAFDHTDFQPSLVNAANLYKTLATWIKMIDETIFVEGKHRDDDNERLNKASNRMGARTKLVTINKDIVHLDIEPIVKTVGQLRQLKKEVGAVVIGLQGVNRLPIKEPPKAGQRDKSYDNVFEQLAEDVNAVADMTEVDMLAMCDNITDVMKEGSVVKGRVVSKSFNNWLGHIEGSLSGIARNAADKAGFTTPGNKAAINKRVKTQFLNKIDFTKVKWSKSQEEEIHDQVAKIAMGKKYKPVKKKPSKPGKLKTSKITGAVKKTQTAAKLRKARQKQKRLMATLNKPYAVKKEKRREAGGTDLAELTKLEKIINKRLPAEVRRNMGRPALRNQTGRFSNSVELESLRPTAKGLSGEYSYQLSPYETFENTGSRKWPVGYNPKPLITKSIRNLAMQYTAQKLVSLRRI